MAGSSLILSWENPPDLFVPAVRSATLYRRLHDIPMVIVQEDITWGVALDTENSDPTAEYLVVYHGPFGENLYTVHDQDIVRYAAPSTICEITIEAKRPDGAPDAGQVLEFSDENTGTGQFVRHVVLNTNGRGSFFAMPNSCLLLRVNGASVAWNIVVPDVRKITLGDLIAQYGSPTEIDPRRAIGLN